jgi:hypothetical protein
MGQLVEQFAAGPAGHEPAGAGEIAAAGAAQRRVTLVTRDAAEWARIHSGLLLACDDLARFALDAAFREEIVRAATLPVSLAAERGDFGGGGGGVGFSGFSIIRNEGSEDGEDGGEEEQRGESAFWRAPFM